MVSILLYHRTTYSQKEKFPLFTRPDGLIDKNTCRNATQLLYTISNVGDYTDVPPRGSTQATVECFGSFTKLLTSLIAEWYGVWQEVAQVQQGLTLLVLGWVTAC